MKISLIAIALCCPILVGAQCKFMTNKVDEFTGQTEKYLELAPIYRNVHASVGRQDSMYVLIIYASVGCASTGKSKIYIKYEDGKVLELKHEGGTDCATPVGIYSNITYDVADLKTKAVSKIRVSGTESTIDFEPKDKYFFVSRLKCVE